MCDTGMQEPASSELTAHLVEVGMKAIRERSPAKIPIIVEVPELMGMEAAGDAIAICQQLGVLADHGGGGWLLLPAGVGVRFVDTKE